MRKLEREGSHPEPWLRPRNGAPKVRRGEVGGFRTELSADDIAYLNDVFGIGDQAWPSSHQTPPDQTPSLPSRGSLHSTNS